MDDAWFVVLIDGPPPHPAQAADVVAAAATGLTRFDTVRALHSESGFIPIALSRGEAQRCASALSREGFAAMAVPRARLVRPPPARVVAAAAATDAGLSVTPQPGAPPHLLPWRCIRALRVARVLPGKGDLRFLDLPARPRERPRPAVEKPEPCEPAGLGWHLAGEALSWLIDLPLAEVWLAAGYLSECTESEPQPSSFTGQPPAAAVKAPEVWLELLGIAPLLRLRIRRGTFDYSALGAARSLSSRANFAVLLRSLLGRLGGVVRSGPIEEVLAQGLRDEDDPQEALEQREHELALVGLLTRLALRGPPAD